jgi:hypothetical protein
VAAEEVVLLNQAPLILGAQVVLQVATVVAVAEVAVLHLAAAI